MNSVAPIPLLRRSWYVCNCDELQTTADDVVLGQLTRGSAFAILPTQRDAWLAQLSLLRMALAGCTGRLYLEFTIPRMGRRVDAVLFTQGVVFAIEFKIGAKDFTREDMDQAYDYAMDLKYFHEASHGLSVVPVLVADEARPTPLRLVQHRRVSGLYETVCANGENLRDTIRQLSAVLPRNAIEAQVWENSRYCPTPTIVEAARALYAGHGVADISRADAGAINLRDTSEQLARIIENARAERQKVICFVTGVPGAGKTLVGLNMATQYNVGFSHFSRPRMPKNTRERPF